MRLLSPLALILLAAPAMSQPMPPGAAPAMLRDATLLDISARGEARKAPDLAIINAGVVTQAADAATAIRDNAARMARVAAALTKAGVAERDIQTATLNLSPQYRYAENQPPVITGYQAMNTLTIRFRDIARAGAILDALVASGVNQINGPELTLDDPAAALDAARLEAMAKARARAELYARAAGLKVARIVSISESTGGFRPIPMPMMRMDAAAAPPAESRIQPGEQSVAVELAVRFELR